VSSRNMDDIAAFLKKLKFKKATFGGYDKADVWKKIDLLQKEYRFAYQAQEERYRALLGERDALLEKAGIDNPFKDILPAETENAGEDIDPKLSAADKKQR